MSKLDDLIQKFCPNGVKHLELGAVCKTISTGKQRNRDTLSKIRTSQMSYPVINGGISESGFTDEFNTEANIITVSQGGASAGFVSFMTERFWCGAHCYVIKPAENEILDNRFLYFFIKESQDTLMGKAMGAGIPGLNRKYLNDLKIPVPPLEVQKEIVDILDKFTQLEAALHAELEARQRQYAYYRNQLFMFDESQVRWLELGEVCKVSRGRVMSKDYLTDNAGEFPVYSSQTANNGIFGRINSYDYDFESITWTTDGANAGSVFYHNNEKFSITNVCGLLQVKSESLSTRFLYYALQMLTKPHVSAGMGNPKLMSNVMSKIKVPVPPIEEQNRIVNILDNFDLMVNGISEGLPAEIKARRKQYEYYRTKLLTFQEMPA